MKFNTPSKTLNFQNIQKWNLLGVYICKRVTLSVGVGLSFLLNRNRNSQKKIPIKDIADQNICVHYFVNDINIDVAVVRKRKQCYFRNRAAHRAQIFVGCNTIDHTVSVPVSSVFYKVQTRSWSNFQEQKRIPLTICWKF